MRRQPRVNNCSSGCPTQDHNSYGECLRSKSVKMGYDPAKGFDATRERKWQAELKFARGAMESGILPDNTGRRAVEHAYEMSDKTGMAYRSDTRPDLAEANEHLGLT